MTLNYNEKTLEHYRHPKNMGPMENPDVDTTVTSPVCGDIMEIRMKVKNNIIVDVKFETLGCAASIATGSVLTEMVKGKTLEQAQKITADKVREELGGLPDAKIHCSQLAVGTLYKAIEDYLKKRKG